MKNGILKKLSTAAAVVCMIGALAGCSSNNA